MFDEYRWKEGRREREREGGRREGIGMYYKIGRAHV